MTNTTNATAGDDVFTLWTAYDEHTRAVANGSHVDDATSAGNDLETLRLLTLLAAEAEHLRSVYAYVAVMDGASWSEVGTAAGMTKQGAQQKWGRNGQGVTAEQARAYRLAARAKR